MNLHFSQQVRNTIAHMIALFFAMLFLYAACSKLLDAEKFLAQVRQSPLLTPFAKTIVWSIPTFEIVVALSLANARTRVWGLYASFTLMLLFSFYIIAITRFSSFIPCSCGGILDKMSWNVHLLFNLVAAGVSVMGIVVSDEPSNEKHKTDAL